MKIPSSRLLFALLALGALGGIAGALLLSHPGCGRSPPRVVLYCAQDREFAVDVLAEFTRRTGLEVAPKFDTEADKSVSLYEELVREAKRPRCDVFWNNEILSTIRLQRQGLLEPYNSPSAAPYPDFAKAADHTWHAFAERARVLIINTQLVPEKDRPRSLFDLTDPRFAQRVAMAKPQFGTTATHAACLFEVLGDEAAQRFYRGLRDNGVQIVQGNKQVAVGVGQGEFAVGMTDTDDAIAEVKAGRPVVIVFPDRDGHPDYPRMGTLFIPNTLGLIRGGPNPDGGRKLIDYLLSAEMEKRLAEAASHQIPLNPQVQAMLPPQIETRKTVKPMQVDWDKAAEQWDRVQTFLSNEIARP
ncbi:MAG TPA: extracellular solute-binding protein [Gemmataceae bacterium]|nr:extracellular solute-binding protein [Gemmataceae bacterium]